MKRIEIYLVFVLPFMLFSCVGKSNRNSNEAVDETNSGKVEIKYARGFVIQHLKDYTKIEVRNPWDTTKILETYLLVKYNNQLPKDLPQGLVVKVPIKRAGLCSSIFAGEYSKLNALERIVAVSEPEYFNIEYVKKGVAQGSIVDLGVSATLNTEKVLSSKLDILVLSPFEVSVNDRFKDNGICVVKDASYMEESPLGRAEWIKFEAAFLDKDSLADVLFKEVEQKYLHLCKLVSTTTERPTVFAEKKYADSWYVAGANSYMGQFYKDAGANYLWSDVKKNGSVPLNFEKVYERAVNAQFWLFKYNDTRADMTLQKLQDEYELYKNFKAFKTGNVFALNSGKVPFYEEGPLEPDVVLADLIKIFHPELLPDYTPKYYSRLK